mgnify:CR=1 FL=1
MRGINYGTGGAGNENGTPLINLNQSSCIRGLTIFYPDQNIDNVKPYPWTIQGKGMHCSVIDVTLHPALVRRPVRRLAPNTVNIAPAIR